MRTQLLVIPLVLLAGACTGSDNNANPSVTPTEINPCEVATPPPGCITSTPGAATAFPYPADAGKISPLPVPPPFDGELVRRDNSTNPRITTSTFTVIIPKGKVIASDVICQGRGDVEVKTTPTSNAELTMTCNGNDIPSQFGVFAPTPVAQDTTYTFKVATTGPSRWLIAVSARAPQ